MDRQTALKRIVMEVHKENPEDEILAMIALLKAFDFYTPHRFFFNETVGDFTLIIGQAKYDRESYWPNLERMDSLWLLKSQRWQEIMPLHSGEFISTLRPEEAVPGFPSRWTYYEDAMHLDPVPDEDYDYKLLYTRKTDIPTASWDGINWTYTKASGGPWLETDTCEFLTYAPELSIARAKWDLYFNVYDDAENAQKMQMLVDIEYSRLAKKLSNLKLHVARVPTRI